MSLIKSLLLLCVSLCSSASKWPSMPLGRPMRRLEGPERVQDAKPKVRVVRASFCARRFVSPHPLWAPNKLERSVLYFSQPGQSTRHIYLRPVALIRPRRGQAYWCFIRPRLQRLETGIATLFGQHLQRRDRNRWTPPPSRPS